MLIQLLADAGCRRIELGSFVSPKYVPTMANSEDVVKALDDLRRQKNLHLSCLVPSSRYMEQAVRVRPDEVAIFASASEAFSQKV